MNETINSEDLYLFQTGKARQAYLTFGCHYQNKTKTHRFTVWAPNAKSVSVVGDFNFWNPLAHPMKGDKDGIYTIEIEGLKKGDLYKYHVEGYDGICRYNSSVYSFCQCNGKCCLPDCRRAGQNYHGIWFHCHTILLNFFSISYLLIEMMVGLPCGQL